MTGSRGAHLTLAVLGGLLGIGLLFTAFDGPAPPLDSQVASVADRPASSASGPPSAPTSRRDTAARPPAGTADLVTGPVLPAAPPVTITIPRLGVSSGLESLGLENGAMEVPEDPAKAGWYRLGPTPGALGPAVIAGHVSWNGAPAVFSSLAGLHRGDVVRVTRRDGRVAVFQVTGVEHYPKSMFPTRHVFGAIDHAGLRLITCGGDYDGSAHRYADNVVVFATLTSAAP